MTKSLPRERNSFRFSLRNRENSGENNKKNCEFIVVNVVAVVVATEELSYCR